MSWRLRLYDVCKCGQLQLACPGLQPAPSKCGCSLAPRATLTHARGHAHTHMHMYVCIFVSRLEHPADECFRLARHREWLEA